MGVLSEEKCNLIADACDEIIEGKLDKEFPLVIEITGFEMLPLFNPAAGIHVYVYPVVGKLPKGALVPEQIETLLPALATGNGLVVITIVSLLEQPFKVVVKM